MQKSIFSSKKLSFGLVIIAILIIFSLDRLENSKPQKVAQKTAAEGIPEAIFKVGDEEVPYKAGKYEWVKTGLNGEEMPDELIGLPYTSVSPFERIQLSFKKKPIKLEYALWQEGFVDIFQEGLTLLSLNGDSIPLSNLPGNFHYFIRATWENNEAHYVVPLTINEELPYQTLLAEEEGRYSILVINENKNTDTFFADNQIELSYNLTTLHTDNVQTAREIMPGLKIDALPHIALLDDKKIIFQTNKQEEMIEFVKKLEE